MPELNSKRRSHESCVMTAPNMATLTASLERSLRNCSLSHPPATAASATGFPRSSGSSSHAPDAVHHTLPGHRFQPTCLDLSPSSPSSTTATTLVDLNSHISLPYHWEQCLDLETGEIYYRNWRNGMKAKEDPRLIYDTEDDNDADNEDDDDNESYDGSEGSSTTEQYSSPQFNSYMAMNNNHHHAEEEVVLVVAGCKSCLMYYMVPKHVLDCPKCSGHLLHFDRSENTSSN